MTTLTTVYKFKVGNVVTHRHEDNLVGTIVKCTTYGEVGDDSDDSCDDQPWYEINWTTVPVGEQPHVGNESESSIQLHWFGE